jgi:hypothetical protein
MTDNTEERHLKEKSFAYVAGLIDADGSLYISRSTSNEGYCSFDPIIMIRSTHLPTIKYLVKTFGGSYDESKWENDQWKKYYRWKFTSDKNASLFLEKILPYLWLKKEQGLLLKQYYELEGSCNKSLRHEIANKVSSLNQSESVTTNTSNLLSNAYIAGMFDGEGSSYIIKVKQSKQSRSKGVYYRACISLGSTSKALAEELKRKFGGSWRQRPPHNGNLPMYEWDIKDNKGKENFLLAILPYLTTKYKQSKIVLDFVRMNKKPDPEKRKSMWIECTLLNGKKRESDLIGNNKSDIMVT